MPVLPTPADAHGWHSQKVWNVHATTTPNWHLANSTLHWTVDFLFPTEIASGGYSQHKPLLSQFKKQGQGQQRLIVGYKNKLKAI